MTDRSTGDGLADADDIHAASEAKRGSPYLTVKQAAYYLGLSPRTIDDLRYKGRGPRFRRLGRSIRYHIRDLDAFAKAHGGRNGER